MSSEKREKRTLIEEGTELKGTVSSSCPIDVMGKLEGDVSGPSIHISQTGVVAGSVKVKELRSEGEVAGEIDAETVELSGRVRDKTVIRAASLEVHLASEAGRMEVVFGECELAIGEAPSKEAAIAAALAPPQAAPPPAKEEAPPAEAPAEAKPGDEGWAVPAGESAAAESKGAEEGEDRPRERRRRGTLPPPPA